MSEPAFDKAQIKAQIAAAFGRSHTTYDDQARVQARCARMLLRILDDQIGELPPGPVLELGCGTGFLSQGLWERFGRWHPLEITDVSEAMLGRCQVRLGSMLGSTLGPAKAKFYLLDGEAIPPKAGPYALIASNFAVQWFQDPQGSVVKLLQSLQPGGWLLLSFPSCHSFRQWRQQCEQLALPYPANPLPNPTPMIAALWGQAQDFMFEQHFLPLVYPSAIAFLQHFKAIGAATPVTATVPSNRLSPRQLRQLIRTWDQQSPGQIEVDYHAVLLAIQR